MNRRIQIETGAQLLARLTNRPSLQGVEKILFSDGLRHNEVVEISGDSSSGKTLLITRLIAKCLLPIRYKGIELNGSGAGVVLINTDHHFQISMLVNSMAYFIRREKREPGKETGVEMLDDEVVRQIIENSLSYLTVINCYTSDQYCLALQSLQTILSNDDKISMISVDSMSSYYWEDRGNGGVWSMNEYLRSFLKNIRKYISCHKVVLVYTKLSDFASKGIAAVDSTLASDRDKINYKVQLHRWGENKFSAVVESMTDKKTLGYTISDNGIEWKTIGGRN